TRRRTAGIPASGPGHRPVTVDELLSSAVGAIGGSTRSGQQEMAQAVASAVDKGIHLLVPAGTGGGKSPAYLVPAAEYVSRTGGKVVVSTATLALQTQIIHRDLPRLFKAVKKDLDPLPRAALLKGRRNYVCKHKLAGGYPDEGEGMLFDLGADAEAGRKPSERSGLGEEIQRIRTWEKITDTGDRDDLMPGVSDRAWSQVSVNAFDCLGSNCPLVTECFAEIARNKAAEADIVVTNHALLAIDAFGESTVLPDHDVIIIDEAHELKDRVTNALSGQINTSMLQAATSSVRRHTTVQDGVVSLLDSAAAALERAQSSVSEGLILNMSEAVGRIRGSPWRGHCCDRVTRRVLRRRCRRIGAGHSRCSAMGQPRCRVPVRPRPPGNPLRRRPPAPAGWQRDEPQGADAARGAR